MNINKHKNKQKIKINFFRGAPKISRKNDLYTFILGEKWLNKI